MDYEYIDSLVQEAREEDKREGSHFDRDGWGNFFLEEWKTRPEEVAAAWRIYDSLTHQIGSKLR
jgi:hypothetical protein